MKRFLHSGHIGDIIAFLPTMRALGGGELIITDEKRPSVLEMKGFRYESIAPLLRNQPYISAVSFQEKPAGFTHNACAFRRHWGKGSIVEMHAMEFNVKPSTEKWLNAEPDERTKGRIVCCRSPRYRNDSFPWRDIVDICREEIVFVGLHDEYGDFIRNFGSVERMFAKDCLELAGLIAGSRRFIGNQSSPFWIAAGLNHPLIQETSVDVPDSIVEYPDAIYCKNSHLDIETLLL